MDLVSDADSTVVGEEGLDMGQAGEEDGAKALEWEWDSIVRGLIREDCTGSETGGN